MLTSLFSYVVERNIGSIKWSCISQLQETPRISHGEWEWNEEPIYNSRIITRDIIFASINYACKKWIWYRNYSCEKLTLHLIDCCLGVKKLKSYLAMKSSSFCSPNVSRTTLSSRSTPSWNAKSHSLWGVACNLFTASVMLHVWSTSTVDILITVIEQIWRNYCAASLGCKW